jgi:hypothetical protein
MAMPQTLEVSGRSSFIDRHAIDLLILPIGIESEIGCLFSQQALKGISVLGRYPSYLQKAEELGARYFKIPANIWNKMSPAEQWIANKKFLDRAIARGDRFALSSPLSEARSGTWFGREIEYLRSKGYVSNPSGTEMVPRLKGAN